MNNTQPPDKTNNPPKKKKGKPVSKLTRYELSRLRQKLWRDKPEVMEKIRTYAVQVAQAKFRNEDEEFRLYVATNIPEQATMEQIRTIVEAGNALNRTFKRPSRSRLQEARQRGEVRLSFNSFVTRCRRKGYLRFDLESFLWFNTAKQPTA